MKTVLIAEDDKFLSSAYRLKLEKAGLNTLMAEDGQQALDLLQKHRPDLILLDLIMPVKDGFQVLEAISQKSSLKDIPVIVASNPGQKEDIDKSLSFGAKEFVIKSDLSLDSLVAKIKSLLKLS